MEVKSSSNNPIPIKQEPDLTRLVNNLSRDHRQQKEKYQREIVQLRQTYDEQLRLLQLELEQSKQSSRISLEYQLELESFRQLLDTKENDLLKKDKQIQILLDQRDRHEHSNNDLQTKNAQLTADNLRLNNELTSLTVKHQALSDEMQAVREFVLKMLASTD